MPATSNTKEEKCHISRRSYPYLLAQKMHLSGNRFKSVACSGATTKDIIANKDDYEGQGSMECVMAIRVIAKMKIGSI